jgi:excisionase family DNA binding protein
METSIKERRAWSPKEFAEATGLSLGFVRKDINQGGIHAVRAGRRLLIPDTELRRYLEEGSLKKGS